MPYPLPLGVISISNCQKSVEGKSPLFPLLPGFPLSDKIATKCAKLFKGILDIKIWIISKLVDRIFYENLPRARKESQIAPQASAGYCFP